MAAPKKKPNGRSSGSGNSQNNDVYKIRVEVLVVTAAVCLVIGYIGRGILERDGADARSQDSPFAAASLLAPPTPQSVPSQTSGISALQAEANKAGAGADTWTKLGNTYFDTGQYELAIDAYKRSLAIDPENPDVITDLGIMYRRSGRPDEAVEAFKTASGIDPTHQMSRFNIGIVLLYDKLDRNGARKAWEELAKMNPRFTAPDGQTISKLVESLR